MPTSVFTLNGFGNKRGILGRAEIGGPNGLWSIAEKLHFGEVFNVVVMAKIEGICCDGHIDERNNNNNNVQSNSNNSNNSNMNYIGMADNEFGIGDENDEDNDDDEEVPQSDSEDETENEDIEPQDETLPSLSPVMGSSSSSFKDPFITPLHTSSNSSRISLNKPNTSKKTMIQVTGTHSSKAATTSKKKRVSNFSTIKEKKKRQAEQQQIHKKASFKDPFITPLHRHPKSNSTSSPNAKISPENQKMQQQKMKTLKADYQSKMKSKSTSKKEKRGVFGSIFGLRSTTPEPTIVRSSVSSAENESMDTNSVTNELNMDMDISNSNESQSQTQQSMPFSAPPIKRRRLSFSRDTSSRPISVSSPMTKCPLFCGFKKLTNCEDPKSVVDWNLTESVKRWRQVDVQSSITQRFPDNMHCPIKLTRPKAPVRGACSAFRLLLSNPDPLSGSSMIEVTCPQPDFSDCSFENEHSEASRHLPACLSSLASVLPNEMSAPLISLEAKDGEGHLETSQWRPFHHKHNFSQYDIENALETVHKSLSRSPMAVCISINRHTSDGVKMIVRGIFHTPSTEFH
eukprot:TRINITY_DN6467_c0_g1_i1.p1 TRINITY_DN6467_c0_g1~~TRINITY_DN6467_c0_g1_i1.p1  ORF type:complete len:571 (+),score=187.45 TRINITY_DN6467_c0_g1_i1:176-1888(+)